MINYLDEWLARKCERPFVSIREPFSARFKFSRPLGPRSQYAVVQLKAEPSTFFAFDSIANWPDPEANYTTAVLDGILDELFATGVGSIAEKIHFTLEEIGWHDVDSCATAFYHAARGAVRQILGLNHFPSNIQWPTN